MTPAGRVGFSNHRMQFYVVDDNNYGMYLHDDGKWKHSALDVSGTSTGWYDTREEAELALAATQQEAQP